MAKRGKARRHSKPQRISTMPLGVKIISVLAYVLSAVLLLMGIFVIGAGSLLTDEQAHDLLVQMVEDSTASTTVASGLAIGLIVGGIICIVFAAVLFFIGRGLWKGKRWARILMIVLTALGFAGALADLLRGEVLNNLFDLVVNGWIAGYLLFSSRVQKAFR